MSGQRGLIVVFNPKAGSRHRYEALRSVRTRFDDRIGAVVETSLDGSFAPRLRDAVRHARGDTGLRPIVLAVGGDGTFGIALNALQEAGDATLGAVPAGSGNDFAVALGTATLDAALQAIDRGTTRDVDFGLVNGRRFANCVGMGLDAEVGKIAARLRARGYPGAASYYIAAFAGLFMVKPVGVSLEANGARRRYDDGVMVTVGNGHLYGGGFRGAPNAAIDDGKLDAYAFSDVSGFMRRLALMQRIRAGTHVGEPNVDAYRVDALTVEFDREVAMHVDGEIAAVKRAEIAVVTRGMSALAFDNRDAR